MSLPLIVVALDHRQSGAVYHDSSKPQMRASLSKVRLQSIGQQARPEFYREAYSSTIRAYLKSLADIPINRMSKRHPYSSLALARVMPLWVLQLLISSTMSSHVQLGISRVSVKKILRRERSRLLETSSAYTLASVYLVRIGMGAFQRQRSGLTQHRRCVFP